MTERPSLSPQCIYISKATLGSPEVSMTLAEIDDAYNNGSLPPTALVRAPHQDFWYGVKELLGHEETPTMFLKCPGCGQMVPVRRIDQGLAAPCVRCGHVRAVGDPALARAAVEAEVSLARQKQLMIASLMVGGAFGLAAFLAHGGFGLLSLGYIGMKKMLIVDAMAAVCLTNAYQAYRQIQAAKACIERAKKQR